MNGAKRSAEDVGCKNESAGERSALERSTRASRIGRSGSENDQDLGIGGRLQSNNRIFIF